MEDKTKWLKPNALLDIEDVIFDVKINPRTPAEIIEGIEGDDPAVIWAISRLINYISSQIEGYIGRPLGRATYTENKITAQSSEIHLDNFPIRKLIKIQSVPSGGTYDVETITKWNNPKDLNTGRVYLQPFTQSNSTYVGMGRYPQLRGRSLVVEYEAGYILPLQATEDEPSDLPEDIRGIASDLVREIFAKTTDQVRAEGLMQLQEGNINRVWASSITTDMNKYGDIPIQQAKVLDKYKSTMGLMSS